MIVLLPIIAISRCSNCGNSIHDIPRNSLCSVDLTSYQARDITCIRCQYSYKKIHCLVAHYPLRLGSPYHLKFYEFDDSTISITMDRFNMRFQEFYIKEVLIST